MARKKKNRIHDEEDASQGMKFATHCTCDLAQLRPAMQEKLAGNAVGILGEDVAHLPKWVMHHLCIIDWYPNNVATCWTPPPTHPPMHTHTPTPTLEQTDHSTPLSLATTTAHLSNPPPTGISLQPDPPSLAPSPSHLMSLLHRKVLPLPGSPTWEYNTHPGQNGVHVAHIAAKHTTTSLMHKVACKKRNVVQAIGACGLK